jgi:hypothetical protein
MPQGSLTGIGTEDDEPDGDDEGRRPGANRAWARWRQGRGVWVSSSVLDAHATLDRPDLVGERSCFPAEGSPPPPPGRRGRCALVHRAGAVDFSKLYHYPVPKAYSRPGARGWPGVFRQQLRKSVGCGCRFPVARKRTRLSRRRFRLSSDSRCSRRRRRANPGNRSAEA